MNCQYSIALYLILLTGVLHGQHKVLDDYIRQGLKSNIALKQKNLDYQAALQAVKNAKSYYWPQVTLNARYSRADGGRVIDLPVGDMLNPVYDYLNQDIGANVFPQIDNREFQFLRTKEHETKVRVTQPLLNGEIFYNHQIKKSQLQIQKAGRDVYVRQLITEIKKAYFKYLKTRASLDILEETRKTLSENLRVTNKLYKNEKVTYDKVLQARTAISRWEEQKAQYYEKMQKARAWFNYLLNRDLESNVRIDKQFDSLQPLTDKNAFVSNAAQREEFDKLDAAIQARGYQKKLEQSAYWPDISAIFDYGFQGKTYQFEHDDDFYIASVVLQWPVFRGMRRKVAVEQATIAHQKSTLRRKKVQQQIQIEVSNAFYAVNAAYKRYIASEKKLKTTRATWKMIHKKYRQGMVSQLEHTDALEKYRIAREKKALSRYDFYIKKTELEHAAAKIDIHEKYEE